MVRDYGRLFRSRRRGALRPLTRLTAAGLLGRRGLSCGRRLLATLATAGPLSPTLTLTVGRLGEQSKRKQKGCEHVLINLSHGLLGQHHLRERMGQTFP
jgi:hypothetical protein